MTFFRTSVAALALASTAIQPVFAQATRIGDAIAQDKIATSSATLNALAAGLETYPEDSARILAAARDGGMPIGPLTQADLQTLQSLNGIGAKLAFLTAHSPQLGGSMAALPDHTRLPQPGLQSGQAAFVGQETGILVAVAALGLLGLLAALAGRSSGSSSSFDTAEYQRMNTGAGATGTTRISVDPNAVNPMTRMGALTAYGQGFTGAGTKIAVLDDGFLTSHQEFAGKGNVQLSTVSTPTTVAGANPGAISHGTHVAGLAAGAKDNVGTHGMAFDAGLFLGSNNLNVFGLTAWTNELTAANVDVWNNSWGIPGGIPAGSNIERSNSDVSARSVVAYANNVGNSATAASNVWGGTAGDWNNWVAAIQNYQNNAGAQGNGGVVLWSNSNQGKAPADAGFGATDLPFLPDVDANAALPLLFPILQGAWIVVGNATATTTADAFLGPGGSAAATEKSADGSITLISAKCGNAAAFCAVADGVQVSNADSTSNSAYQNITGTSMAGPLVAGAVAILRQAFPNLSAQDITSRLLATANNSVTGSGQGTSTFNFASGATLQHGYSDLFGHGFIDVAAALAALGGTRSVSASGRSFSTDGLASSFVLSGSFGAGIASRVADVNYVVKDITNAQFRRQLGGSFVSAPNDFMTDTTALWRSASQAQTADFGPIGSMSYQLSNGTSTGAIDASKGITFRATPNEESAISIGFDTDINSAIGFASVRQDSSSIKQADDGFALGYTQLYEERSRWASFSQERKNGTLTYGGFINSDEGYSSAGILAERSLNMGEKLSMYGTVGAMREKGGILGSRTSGAFSIPSSDSVFGRVGLEYKLAPNVLLRGAYSMARTDARTNGSFVEQVDGLVSDSFAVGFAMQNIAGGKDNALSVTVSQPLRARSGSAVLNLPTSAPSLNTFGYTRTSVDLGAAAQEMRLTIGYSTKIGKTGKLELGAMAIQNAGHVRKSKPDFAAGVNFSMKF